MKRILTALVLVLMVSNVALAEQTKPKKKFNEFKYVNCQIHYAYEEKGKKSDFTFQHVKAQKYGGILYHMKKKGVIDDFTMGKTLKDATKIQIKGYHADKELCKCYPKKK